jgi:hypothetical protein
MGVRKMKIKKGFMLRKVAGENVVVAIGEASKSLNGMIKLNDTGAFVWNLLKDGASKEDIVEKMCKGSFRFGLLPRSVK